MPARVGADARRHRRDRAAPARGGPAALSACTGFSKDQIIVADDQRMHTASLAAAFERASDQIRPGGRVLLVAAGAGTTAGAALSRL